MADAVAILRARDLWEQCPTSIRAISPSPGAESPRLELRAADRAARHRAQRLRGDGGRGPARAGPTRTSSRPSSRARRAQSGRMLAELALARERRRRPDCDAARADRLRRRGDRLARARRRRFGNGGPNQEAALAAALALPEGAAVSRVLPRHRRLRRRHRRGRRDRRRPHGRARRARGDRPRGGARGTSLRRGARGLGDRIVTGPTQTNVNDLFVIAVGSRRRQPMSASR